MRVWPSFFILALVLVLGVDATPQADVLWVFTWGAGIGLADEVAIRTELLPSIAYASEPIRFWTSIQEPRAVAIVVLLGLGLIGVAGRGAKETEAKGLLSPRFSEAWEAIQVCRGGC